MIFCNVASLNLWIFPRLSHCRLRTSLVAMPLPWCCHRLHSHPWGQGGGVLHHLAMSEFIPTVQNDNTINFIILFISVLWNIHNHVKCLGEESSVCYGCGLIMTPVIIKAFCKLGCFDFLSCDPTETRFTVVSLCSNTVYVVSTIIATTYSRVCRTVSETGLLSFVTGMDFCLVKDRISSSWAETCAWCCLLSIFSSSAEFLHYQRDF